MEPIVLAPNQLHRFYRGGARISRGDAVLVPFAAGAYSLQGFAQALRCMAPGPAGA